MLPNVRRYVARVFALVVRCRVMRLLLYSRVGKNRDTGGGPRREPGQPVPPATELSSLVRRFSRHRSQWHIPTCYAQFII